MNHRVLSKIEGSVSGPLVFFVGGLHGNEDAGVLAIKKVFESLEKRNIPIQGKIVGLAGNLQALEENKRFIHYDLNRCWTASLEALFKSAKIENLNRAEDEEAFSLYQAIQKEQRGYYPRKIFVDLHATSSDNGNFIVIPEDEAHNPVVKVLKLPVVIDLDKYLEGTLLKFMHDRGYLAFAFEGGLIGSEQALQLHMAGIWELLKACQVISRDHLHDFLNYDQLVASFTNNLPHIVSVQYRHWINDGDQFKMKPGYHNFQPVKKGEILASDRHGNIQAKSDGLIFMPLYQETGNDGFFIVNEVS